MRVVGDVGVRDDARDVSRGVPSAVPWQEAGLPVEPNVPSTDPVEAAAPRSTQPVVPAFDWKSKRNVAPATGTLSGSGELKYVDVARRWNVVVHVEVA
jgi:hypothetical protein